MSQEEDNAQVVVEDQAARDPAATQSVTMWAASDGGDINFELLLLLRFLHLRVVYVCSVKNCCAVLKAILCNALDALSHCCIRQARHMLSAEAGRSRGRYLHIHYSLARYQDTYPAQEMREA